MKIMGKIVKFCNSNVRDVGDRRVVCNSNKEKVSILNQTATEIWKFLYDDPRHVEDASYEKIVEYLKTKFDLSDIAYDDVVLDVKSCIEDLKNAGLIEVEDV